MLLENNESFLSANYRNNSYVEQLTPEELEVNAIQEFNRKIDKNGLAMLAYSGFKSKSDVPYNENESLRGSDFIIILSKSKIENNPNHKKNKNSPKYTIKNGFVTGGLSNMKHYQYTERYNFDLLTEDSEWISKNPFDIISEDIKRRATKSPVYPLNLEEKIFDEYEKFEN